MVETTRYFRETVPQKRPYIRIDWCRAALESPVRREVQPWDRRIGTGFGSMRSAAI
jgi:hypothetical protein